MLISGALFLVRVIWKRPLFKQAGFDGLIVHALVNLIVQAMKHLLGRLRMTDGQRSCSSRPGRVATVMARHFPKAGWAVGLISSLNYGGNERRGLRRVRAIELCF